MYGSPLANTDGDAGFSGSRAGAAVQSENGVPSDEASSADGGDDSAGNAKGATDEAPVVIAGHRGAVEATRSATSTRKSLLGGPDAAVSLGVQEPPTSVEPNPAAGAIGIGKTTSADHRQEDPGNATEPPQAPQPAPPEQAPSADDPILSLFDPGEERTLGDPVVDNGVSVDSNAARFTSDSEFALAVGGALSGEGGSISFWVQPDGVAPDAGLASLVQLRSHYRFEDRVQIWQDGPNVRLVFADNSGHEANVSYETDSWAPDEWRLVTATWGDGQNALYIDGQLIGARHYQGGFQVQPDTILHIGSNYIAESRSLDGAISRFRLYDRSLTPEEIAALAQQYPQ